MFWRRARVNISNRCGNKSSATKILIFYCCFERKKQELNDYGCKNKFYATKIMIVYHCFKRESNFNCGCAYKTSHPPLSWKLYVFGFGHDIMSHTFGLRSQVAIWTEVQQQVYIWTQWGPKVVPYLLPLGFNQNLLLSSAEVVQALQQEKKKKIAEKYTSCDCRELRFYFYTCIFYSSDKTQCNYLPICDWI